MRTFLETLKAHPYAALLLGFGTAICWGLLQLLAMLQAAAG